MRCALIISITVAMAILAGTNVWLQRSVCKQPWSTIKPFTLQTCAPAPWVEAEMQRYRQLAEENNAAN